MLKDEAQWKHVQSKDNPADSLSRGQLPSEFINNSLWFSGPTWLVLPENKRPQFVEPIPTQLPGLKKGAFFLTPSNSDICSRFSKFDRLVRMLYYIYRWKTLAKRPNESKKKSTKLFPEIQNAKYRIAKILKFIQPFSLEEIVETEFKLVGIIQRERFGREIKFISERLHTRLDPFNPFLDDRQLLRVGGRLKKSDLPYDEKHPLLLPNKHPVTDMIIRKVHEKYLHPGVQTTLSLIRTKFWILNGKDQIRSIIRRCVECIQGKPKPIHAQMADLPKARVTESLAFTHTGVDYFGPIMIKEKRHCNKNFIKTYGCIFVCLASKAVHIELAIDLSTESFLAAFHRFTDRRGAPEHVYSDNGTNFVGANKELREIYEFFEADETQGSIKNYALAERIQWHFNPPASPHFGGLWEAAVKSFKHHLKRVVRNEKHTYEQLNTLLIQIEAILNSRPLCALSSDPNDPRALTPTAILTGRQLKVLPERSLLSVPDNRLSVYNFITKARQDFWKKWSKEYLHELQRRQKWHTSTAELKPGSVVLDDNTPCSRWPLGVILEVFPGSDGIARVASVKTATGVYRRNITRLCILPVT